MSELDDKVCAEDPAPPAHCRCLSSSQVKAGRELLGWSHRDLADRAGLLESTVAWIEAGWGDFPHTIRSLEALRNALEAAGIGFIDNGQACRPEE